MNLYCMVLALDNIMARNAKTTEKHMIGDLTALQKAKLCTFGKFRLMGDVHE